MSERRGQAIFVECRPGAAYIFKHVFFPIFLIETRGLLGAEFTMGLPTRDQVLDETRRSRTQLEGRGRGEAAGLERLSITRQTLQSYLDDPQVPVAEWTVNNTVTLSRAYESRPLNIPSHTLSACMTSASSPVPSRRMPLACCEWLIRVACDTQRQTVLCHVCNYPPAVVGDC